MRQPLGKALTQSSMTARLVHPLNDGGRGQRLRWRKTPEQVVDILRYVLTGELAGGSGVGRQAAE